MHNKLAANMQTVLMSVMKDLRTAWNDRMVIIWKEEELSWQEVEVPGIKTMIQYSLQKLERKKGHGRN